MHAHFDIWEFHATEFLPCLWGIFNTCECKKCFVPLLWNSYYAILYFLVNEDSHIITE